MKRATVTGTGRAPWFHPGSSPSPARSRASRASSLGPVTGPDGIAYGAASAFRMRHRGWSSLPCRRALAPHALSLRPVAGRYSSRSSPLAESYQVCGTPRNRLLPLHPGWPHRPAPWRLLLQGARVAFRQTQLARLQQPAHDLARAGLWQRGEEVDLPRRHARPQLLARELQQLAPQFVRWLGAVLP